MNLTDLIGDLEAAGLNVLDLRGQLSTHPTKTFAKRDPEALKGIVFHHAASEGDDVKDLEAIARYHVGPNHVSSTGAPGILYTLAILGDGTVVVNHELETATWSQGYAARPGDENKEFLACLVLGNFDSPSNPTGKNPSLAQVRAALGVMDVCVQTWGWDVGDVYGHFDFGKAACPGACLESLIRAIRSNAPKEPLPSVYDLDTVKGRQEALKKLGFYDGSVDGSWGPKSKAALVAFQTSAAVVADAVFGSTTRKALAEAISKETHQ